MSKSTLTPAESALLLASAAQLRAQFVPFANAFYLRLFSLAPHARSLFSKDFHSGQAGTPLTAMANSMANVLMHLVQGLVDAQAGDFSLDIDRVAAKHASRAVNPDHFPVLGDAISDAIRDTIPGDKAHVEEVVTVWSKAFKNVSEIVIDAQTKVAKEAAQVPNGWEGFREFVVETKQEVREVIPGFEELSEGDEDELEEDCYRKQVKLVIRPTDGGKVPIYKERNFVCFRFTLDDAYGITHKNYELKGTPENDRFTVMLDPEHDRSACTKKIISHFTEGTKILVSAPMGSGLVMESLIE